MSFPCEREKAAARRRMPAFISISRYSSLILWYIAPSAKQVGKRIAHSRTSKLLLTLQNDTQNITWIIFLSKLCSIRGSVSKLRKLENSHIPSTVYIFAGGWWATCHNAFCGTFDLMIDARKKYRLYIHKIGIKGTSQYANSLKNRMLV